MSDAADFTVSGTDSVSISTLGETPSDWEPYEGVLVTLDYTVSVTTDADEYGGCALEADLIIDDEFYSHGSASGDTYESLTGIISWAYGEWRIYPRDASDLD